MLVFLLAVMMGRKSKTEEQMFPVDPWDFQDDLEELECDLIDMSLIDE